MKLPMFTMTMGKILKSKGMLAGLGLICLGGYLIKEGQAEIGIGVIMNGLGVMGVRDAII